MPDVLIKIMSPEETDMTTEECHVDIKVWLPGVNKESLHNIFQGRRPYEHLDLGLLTSRTVKQTVYTNLACGPLLQQPWQTDTPLILSFLHSGSTPTIPIRSFLLSNDLWFWSLRTFYL